MFPVRRPPELRPEPLPQRLPLRQRVVKFDNATELKTTDGNAPTEFIIAGADGVFYVADAVINGTTVELSSENVPSPVYVRHAFEGFPRPNLVDETGLPAEPFRTDSIDKVYPFEG